LGEDDAISESARILLRASVSIESE